VNATVLSVDLGGTRMRAAVVDREGQIQLRAEEPTPHQSECPDAFMSLLDRVRDQGGGRGSFSSVVVGVPGRVDYVDGRLEYAPNLPEAWIDDLTTSRLSQRFEAPVFLANDADLATVGEAYFGAGRPHDDVVYVTISTGIGAGAVFDGRVFRGTRSLAEVGHTIIAIEKLLAGEPATAEELGSGTALGREASVVGLAGGGAEVVALAEAGDPAANAVWDRTIRAAGIAIVNLAHILGPDAIVIGGGMGLNGDLVHQPVRALLAEHGPRNPSRPIEVVAAQLGDDAGLVGGAAWELAANLS